MTPSFVTAQLLFVRENLLAYIASELQTNYIFDERLIRVAGIKFWECGDGDGGARLRDFPGQDSIQIVHISAREIVDPRGMES